MLKKHIGCTDIEGREKLIEKLGLHLNRQTLDLGSFHLILTLKYKNTFALIFSTLLYIILNVKLWKNKLFLFSSYSFGIFVCIVFTYPVINR